MAPTMNLEPSVDTFGSTDVAPPHDQSPNPPLDIGVLLKDGRLHTIPQSMKLKLVNHTPDASYNYPTKYLHGCNRRFKAEWVQNHSWLHYSISEDGVYSKACALFAPNDTKQQTLGILVNKPFNTWTKQSFTSVVTKSWHIISHP